MMSVELRHLADLLRQLKLRPDLESRARSLSREIERAVWEWGVVDHRKWGRIFAYEVDGAISLLFFALFPARRNDLTRSLYQVTARLSSWTTRTSHHSCRFLTSASSPPKTRHTSEPVRCSFHLGDRVIIHLLHRLPPSRGTVSTVSEVPMWAMTIPGQCHS